MTTLKPTPNLTDLPTLTKKIKKNWFNNQKKKKLLQQEEVKATKSTFSSKKYSLKNNKSPFPFNQDASQHFLTIRYSFIPKQETI